MQEPILTEDFVQTLIGIAQKTPGVTELVDSINRIERRLDRLHRQLAEVQDRISRWNRINILTKTEDEKDERLLGHQIAEKEKDLKGLHHELDRLLRNLFNQLCQTNEDFQKLLVWDLVKQLHNQLYQLKINYGFFGWANWMDHSDDIIVGKEDCIAITEKIESLIRLTTDQDLTVQLIIALTKSALLGTGW